MHPAVRLLIILVLGTLAIAIVVPGVERHRAAAAGVLTTSDGDTVDISAAARAAGPAFAPDVPAADRAWVRTALAAARPEAARLIAESDGLVRFSVFSAGPEAPLGVTRSHAHGFDVSLNVAQLNGLRAADRTTVVLHELGHVVDHALVGDDVMSALQRDIPAGFGCEQGVSGACASEPERFAESFAKWATGDIGVDLYVGYKVPPPTPTLDAWGEPLARLAASAAR